jgi:hypothetical protein
MDNLKEEDFNLQKKRQEIQATNHQEVEYFSQEAEVEGDK